MDCREIKLSLEALLDGQLSRTMQATVEEHLADCQACRDEVGRERTLRYALAAMPVPPHSVDFPDRVLRNASRQVQPTRHTVIGMAMAATLALGVGLGVVLAPSLEAPMDRAAVANAMQRVSLVQAVAQDVRLAFESGQDLRGVTLTVRLPEQVELVGYPGQREISWQTDLASGVNALTLPLVMTGGKGGELVAELDHGEQRKRFHIQVEARAAQDAAVQTPPLVI